MATQLDGGIDQFLEVMFSFLERKTDFFTGATATEAEEMVMSKFKKHLKSAKRRQRELNGEDEEDDDVEIDDSKPKIEELSDEEAEKIAAKAAAKSAKAEVKAPPAKVSLALDGRRCIGQKGCETAEVLCSLRYP
eukprot:TRINITY_DN8038_c0_g1_i3.p1 TRINITY_DN8038_c0_g1~~TRINITY_DN8038_c0_g1_i3.p1  ORF type:complete len:149 (+),score=36.38 TRINITY_DN8038_c0_g1_i3:45-449(+)